MGRRSLSWKYKIGRAGGIDKFDGMMPHATTGQGVWLTKSKETVSPGTGRGTTCSKPMSQRKEKLIRQWAR